MDETLKVLKERVQERRRRLVLYQGCFDISAYTFSNADKVKYLAGLSQLQLSYRQALKKYSYALDKVIRKEANYHG